MKAAILARGLARRMQAADEGAALTPDQMAAADAGLKALMPVPAATRAGRVSRPFLDYLLSHLADAGVLDVALVVAPDHLRARTYYEHEAPPARVSLTFVVQPEPRGTADAVVACEAWAAGQPFLVMNGDNLYPTGVLRDLAALDEPGLPAFRRDDLIARSRIPPDRVGAFALLDVDAGGYLRRIVEKPGAAAMAAAGPAALVSMNCWRFDARMFGPCRDVPRSARGEYELPAAVALALDRGVRFRVIPAEGEVLDLSTRADVSQVAARLAGREVRP
jgi:glucose-1-phosphate thymidylyltransferase